MSGIRVWLVEDDEDWLRGLRAMLDAQPDIAVTLAASTVEEVRLVLANSPGGEAAIDVALMDIMLDGVPAGIGLAEEVAAATGARVIMLTSMEEKELILRSFQAGAIDYRIKSNFEELPAAVRDAAKRESAISPAAAERMREEFRRLKRLEREFETKKLSDLITPSELELLRLVDQGYSQSQIAERQVISIRTVKNHIGNILKKLGLTSSKAAAQEAKDKGLL